MDYLKKIQTFINEGRQSDFVGLWEEYCFNEEVVASELIEILESIHASPLANLFGKIAETGLPLWEKITEKPLKDRVLSLLCDLQTSNSKMFYNICLDYLIEKYGKLESFQDIIHLVGLYPCGNFQYAISRFELFAHLQVGNFVFHKGGWGAGEVMSVSFLQKRCTIEFEGVSVSKDMPFEHIVKVLTPLSSDHFLARRFGNPDEFEQEAKKDPVAVIAMLLKDLGPKTAKEIKDEMMELIIPEEDWNRWWQSAKVKLKKDNRIVIPHQSRDPYQYVEGGASRFFVFEDNYANLPQKDCDARFTALYNFIRDFVNETRNPLHKEKLVAYIQDLQPSYDDPCLVHAFSLQKLLLMQEYLGLSQEQAIQSILDQLSDDEVVSVIKSMHVLALQKDLLQIVQRTNSSWETIYFRIVMTTHVAMIRDMLVKELRNHESTALQLKENMLDVMQHPMKFPELFVWLFMRIMKQEDGIFDAEDQSLRHTLLEKAFEFMYEVSSSEQYRELGKKVHHFLVAGRYLMIRKTIVGASLEYLQELLLLSTKCPQFSSADINALQGVSEVVQPKLKQKKDVVVEDIFWTTAAMLDTMKEKLAHLSGKEMIDNAKEIEDARALGDLRENSEYKFALEKRARIQEDIRVLSEQIQQARVITKQDVSVQNVGIGCRVTLEDSQGNAITYTLLGAWDADPEKHILSMQSKLAQTLLGKQCQDHVALQGKDFTIVNIESIFS